MEKTFILGIKIDVPEFQFSDEVGKEEREQFIKDYTNRLWYYKVYCNLVDKFLSLEKKGLLKDVYTEKHHILPKCLGGYNKKSNRVLLPAREHIMAHLLLHLAFPEDSKLTLAIDLMLFGKGTGGNKKTKLERRIASKKFSTKVIGIIRESASKAKSGKNNGMFGRHHTDSAKAKMSKIHKGKIISEEQKEYYRKLYTGRKVSEKVRKQISESNKGKKRGPLSEETKKKLSEALKKRKSKCTIVQDKEGRIFNSIRECSKFYNVSEAAVRHWLRNPVKGFKKLN